jgi:hypothetical protein
MKAVWLNGWGRSGEETLRIVNEWLPAEHVILQPFEDWRCQLEKHVTSDTWLFGYSLGAFLLLGAGDLAHRSRGAHLFAPFLDIKAEGSSGGRVRAQDIQGLRTLLSISKTRALKRFSRLSRLELDEAARTIGEDNLAWGLTTLLNESRPKDSTLPYVCWAGAQDPLIDAQSLRLSVPHLRVIEPASHRLSSLLSGLYAL